MVSHAQLSTTLNFPYFSFLSQHRANKYASRQVSTKDPLFKFHKLFPI